MNAYTKTIPIFVIASLTMCASCQEKQEIKKGELPEVKATYATQPVKVDGVLDDEVWQKAKVYYLNISKDKLLAGADVEPQALKEGGKVRVAWDNEWLYLAVDFTDSDVVATGEKDGMHHYKLGDLAELFLKYNGQPWYWELYVTPISKKTTFFFPSREMLGKPSCFDYQFQKGELKVAAKVNGTANAGDDRDKGWTAEMAVPVSELTFRGETFGPGAPWRIFVGRYNYPINLKSPELSMMPSLSKTSYHLTDEYAKLIFLPKACDKAEEKSAEKKEGKQK